MIESPKRSPLRLCVCITNPDKRKIIEELFSQAHVGLRFQFKAQGTASSEILDCLGLGETDKIVTIGLSTKRIVSRVFEVLKMELQLSKSGRGIAFTMPISGIANPVYKLLDPSIRQELQHRVEQLDPTVKKEIRERIQEHIESEGSAMKTEVTHDMIIAVVNLGYTEMLMDAARNAGAGGGTVIHARRLGDGDQLNFLGISIQEEREIAGILCHREDRKEIMKAIHNKCGLTTEAQGMIFSLPVDCVAGLETASLCEDFDK